MILQIVGQVMAIGDYTGKKGKVFTADLYVPGEGGSKGDLVRLNLPESLGPEKVQGHVGTRVSAKVDLMFFDGRPAWNLKGIAKA